MICDDERTATQTQQTCHDMHERRHSENRLDIELRRHHHMLTSIEMPYKCCECETTFKSRRELSEHSTQHKGLEFKCDTSCDTISKLLTREGQLFACHWEGCRETYVSREYMTIHERSHTRDHMLRCDHLDNDLANKANKCGNILPKEDIICNINRKFVVNNSDYQLVITERERNSKKDYYERRQRALRKERIRMEMKANGECLASNDSQVSETTGERINNRFKFYYCEFAGCGYVGNDREHLRRHSAVHCDHKSFTCSHCDRGFKLMLYLKRHIAHKHTDKHNRPFNCEKCGKYFVTITQFNAHNLGSHSLRRFQCNACDFKTPLKSTLDNHYRSRHCDDKPFVCVWPECGKSFKLNGNLSLHVNGHHLKKRDFICDEPECGAAFIIKALLDEHKQTKHRTERPFACVWPECNARPFKSELSLKMHIKGVHTKKTYAKGCRT